MRQLEKSSVQRKVLKTSQVTDPGKNTDNERKNYIKKAYGYIYPAPFDNASM